MRKSLSILIVLSLCVLLNAQNYKQIKFFNYTESDLIKYSELGLPLEEGYRNDDGSFLLFLSESEFEKISKSGIKYEIVIDDWFDYYNNLPKMSKQVEIDTKMELKQHYNISGFGYGSMGGYYTMEEVNNKLDSMYLQYPDLITQKYQIGSTIEGRPIYSVKISDNPNISENEPQVLYTGLIHGREPMSMMVIMCYMFYLLENYGINNEVTYLVNNRELLFIPIINVDGYEYNRSIKPNGGGMWRHNRRVNPDSSIGVDLNRNFGYMWGYDDIGSSPVYGNEVYRGEAPFSEPETQAIRDFCCSNNISTAVFNHCYSNIIYFPWGYNMLPTTNNDIYSDIASTMASYNNYEWRISGFSINGDSDDWMYGETNTKNKIFSFTFEIGKAEDGYFWARKNRIFPLAEQNIIPNLILAWTAGGYIKITNHFLTKETYAPGENVNMSVSIKNIGLLSASGLKIVLSSGSQNLNFINDQINISSLAERTELNLDNCFNFSINPSAQAEKVDLNVSIFLGDTLMSSYKTSIQIDPGISAIETAPKDNITYKLQQNYPNPFNPSTRIDYYLEKSGNVKISIFNIIGEELCVLINEYKVSGKHVCIFSINDIPLEIAAGIYYYKIVSGNYSETKKMVVLK